MSTSGARRKACAHSASAVPGDGALQGAPAGVEQMLPGWREPRAARCYQPADAPANRVILYLHEGGFVSGDLASAHAAAQAAAACTGWRVLALDYSLAPAAPFPAALEDVLAALGWCAGQGWQTVLAGVEAGGNLAAAAALAARDRGLAGLMAQVLITPMLDPALSSRSMRDAPLHEARGTVHCFSCYRSYLPEVGDRMHPYAAPALATRLAGLAPALIATAEDDPLRGEAEQYCARLVEAGVPAELVRAPALPDLCPARHPQWLWQAYTRFARERIQSQ